jgi:hypothetical protein
MSDNQKLVVFVTPSQVAAAKLTVERDAAAGRTAGEPVRLIAEATQTQDTPSDLPNFIAQLRHVHGVAEKEMVRIDAEPGAADGMGNRNDRTFDDWLAIWQQLDKLFSMLGR